MQYLFLNGRCIRDRALQHALSEAYRGLLMVGRFPICFLRLDMPAKMVDVNVHPTKMEVRFQDAGRIYGQLLQTLRHKFLSTDLTAKVSKDPTSNTSSVEPTKDDIPRETLFPSLAQDNSATSGAMARGDQFLGMATTAPVSSPFRDRGLPIHDVPPFRPFGDGIGGRSNMGNAAIRSDLSPPPHPPGAQAWTGAAAALPMEDVAAITRVDVPVAAAPVMSHLGLQVHQRYIVTQDETGMVIIDQHALHERIMYEQIRNKVLQGKLETQQLLVPEPVSLTPAEAAAALDAAEMLKQVGIHVEPFGGDTVLITAYPAMLRKEKPAELLLQVLEIWMGAGKRPEPRDLLDHMLHTIACKAAIKAGDRLAPEEITELLQQRHCYQDSHHCPHGRPTALFFSREQLDKMFKRI
jgi:DNA mismatch repair protein MutL